MAQDYTTRTFESTDPKSPNYGTNVSMYEVSDGTRGGASLMRTGAVRKWHRCPICSLEFPETEMFRYRGAWYCEDGYEEMVNSAIRDRRIANDL